MILREVKIYYLIYGFLIFNLISCDKQDEHVKSDEKNIYQLYDISFFLTPSEDQNEFIIDRIDTLMIANQSDSFLPDTTLYPYELIQDSLFVKITSPIDEEMIVDSLPFRKLQIGPDYEVGYLSKDTNYFKGVDDLILFPVEHKYEAIAITPEPNVIYEITGTYWRIRYSISFQAQAIRESDNSDILIEGKMIYSIVSRGARPKGSGDIAPTIEIRKKEIL